MPKYSSIASGGALVKMEVSDRSWIRDADGDRSGRPLIVLASNGLSQLGERTPRSTSKSVNFPPSATYVAFSRLVSSGQKGKKGAENVGHRRKTRIPWHESNSTLCFAGAHVGTRKGAEGWLPRNNRGRCMNCGCAIETEHAVFSRGSRSGRTRVFTDRRMTSTESTRNRHRHRAHLRSARARDVERASWFSDSPRNLCSSSVCHLPERRNQHIAQSK